MFVDFVVVPEEYGSQTGLAEYSIYLWVKVYHLYDLLYGHAVKLCLNMIYDFLRHLKISKSTEKRKSTITYLYIFLFCIYLTFFVLNLSYIFFIILCLGQPYKSGLVGALIALLNLYLDSVSVC